MSEFQSDMRVVNRLLELSRARPPELPHEATSLGIDHWEVVHYSEDHPVAGRRTPRIRRSRVSHFKMPHAGVVEYDNSKRRGSRYRTLRLVRSKIPHYRRNL